jgi:hypothetical protein
MTRTRKTTKPTDSKAQEGNEAKHAKPHELVFCAYVQNAAALEPWGRMFGELSMNDLAADLKEATRRVTRDGNMREPEALLYGQAVALQTIFTSLSRRAALNAGEYMGATETYLRLALKAQAQCRATLETLHEVKNPRPVAFVQQANISHGPQQVNNGSSPGNANSTRTGAHAEKNDSAPSKLLEGHDGERLDFGAQGATGKANQDLAPVGALNGTEDPSG